MKQPLLLFIFLSLILSGALSAQSSEYTLHEGEIEGSPFKVLVPEQPSDGKVFFHVHGWRPAAAPHEADIDPEDPFYQTMLSDGWIIGRTAFAENGVDHDAHTEDLANLRNWIEENIGEISLLIMEGESTAGTLVLRIAENNPELADGVIAKGAFIDLGDRSADSFLKAEPEIPAVLMSNFTELDGPVAYAARAENAAVPPSLRPLLRPGHVNVNWVERKDALSFVYNWISNGTYSPISEGTRTVPHEETGTSEDGEWIVNRVLSIDPYFGNAVIGFHPDELKDAGINQGDSFTFKTGGQHRTVFFGESYGDVEHGEWVAFPLANDRMLIARNHESAIEAANMSAGDTVQIRTTSDVIE